ncbi:unnamed protein product [Vitrella brassicaformis CCMP3155]|uniref:Exostosin GT47 domain-containing protein n=3 Tax=Vitrella brassicaformis TaxID=1169539 RepID=A0A0G4H3P4_VITBC|nr:unnamed protein product [Vitrella brassicaformis CCMP3155]|eukprot:CEM38344.1 unnamed protein product [Vitrella brassicaformis CCMP3155]
MHRIHPQRPGLSTAKPLHRFFIAAIFATLFISWFAFNIYVILRNNLAREAPSAPRRKPDRDVHATHANGEAKGEDGRLWFPSSALVDGVPLEIDLKICHCMANPVIDQAGLPDFVSSTAKYGSNDNKGTVDKYKRAIDGLLAAMHRPIEQGGLRIFQYPPPPFVEVPPTFSRDTVAKARNSAYLVESVFWTQISGSPLRVTDSDLANAYQLPVFPTTANFYGRKYVNKTLAAELAGGERAAGGKLAAHQVKETVEYVRRKWPYYDKQYGRGHFWVISHDGGKAEYSSWGGESLVVNATTMTTNPNPNEWYKMFEPTEGGGEGQAFLKARKVKIRKPYGYDPRVDVSIVPCGHAARAEQALRIGRNLNPDVDEGHSSARGLLGPRQYLAFFAGNAGKGKRGEIVRPAVLDSFKGVSAPTAIYTSHVDPSDYTRYLSSSTFCLCPRGSRVVSPRIIEAIWYTCIPVVIADYYWLPQGCVWDWTMLAVFIPEERANETAAILQRTTREEIVAKQRHLFKVRRHFAYHFRPVAGDALDMTLLELWMRQHYCQRTHYTQQQQQWSKGQKGGRGLTGTEAQVIVA